MREKILKFKILQIQKTESKKFSEIFVWFVEYFKKYFEKQALIYIASLDNLEVLEKDSFNLEDLKKLLEDVYFLGLEEEKQKLDHHLETYWYIAPEIFLDNKEAIKYAEKHSAELIKQIDETTKNEMKDLITESLKNSLSINRIAEKIKDKFDKYSVYRASLIAQMETAIAYSQATRRQNDIFTKKLWIVGWKRAVTQKDSRVRQSHLENEAEGWIPKNQVFSSGDDNAPFGFFCRCRVDYSLVNPESGKLFDGFPEYKEGKINEVIKRFWEEELNFDEKTWNFLEKYNIHQIEMLAFKKYFGSYSSEINNFIRKWVKSRDVRLLTPLLLNWLNKIPNSSWIFYRWLRNEKDIEFVKKLKVWDIYNNWWFFSSSESKNVAKDFLKKWNEVLFIIDTKKWKKVWEIWQETEKEVLFTPTQLFKIDKIENRNNILHIYLSDLK